MTKKDRPKKNVFVFAKVALGKFSRSYTIVNQKFCQTLQLDFNFGFGSRDSKSSGRRVPCMCSLGSHQRSKHDASLNSL